MSDSYTGKKGAPPSTPWWKPIRFVQLFIFMVLYLLFQPLLHKTPFLTALLSLLFLNMLVVTLSLAGARAQRRWPVILPWFVATVLNGVALHSRDMAATGLITALADMSTALLIVACVVMILRNILSSREITVDTVFGAFTAYFLIALIYSSLYHALHVMDPASFSMAAIPGRGSGELQGIEFTYYSFVTIATLGYGDIYPALPAARMLSILEAMTGQFYMAGVIAWIISILVMRRN